MPVTCEQDDFSAFPTSFRIGPSKYAYNYKLIVVNGNKWYKCERGSDGSPNGHKLWMQNVPEGWEAFDASDDDHTSDVVMQFRSKANILNAGWHSWELVQSNGEHGDFKTTILD